MNMQKVLTWLRTNWTATKVIARNFGEFIDAVALTSVSGYAVYQGVNHTDVWYRALLLAGVLIALQAFGLLVRHFNKA